MLELIAVMELGVVRGSIDPHLVDDFKPAMTESAQRIGVTAILLAVMPVVNLGPWTTRQTLLGKKMDRVAEVFVTGPALMAVTIFSGALSYRSCAAKAL